MLNRIIHSVKGLIHLTKLFSRKVTFNTYLAIFVSLGFGYFHENRTKNSIVDYRTNSTLKLLSSDINKIDSTDGDISLPFFFTNNKSSYRTCLRCGARKRFDAQNLKTFGPFYYPPAASVKESWAIKITLFNCVL